MLVHRQNSGISKKFQNPVAIRQIVHAILSKKNIKREMDAAARDIIEDPDVIKDIYLDDKGLGLIDLPGDGTEVQMMLDSMANSEENFF